MEIIFYNIVAIVIGLLLAYYGSISMKFIKDVISFVENKDAEKLSNAIVELQNTSSDYKIFIKKMVQELSYLAVQIKTNTYHGNLTYSQIKSIIFEFNDCLNKININVNPFIMIEMILLNGFDEVEVTSVKTEDTSKKIEQILLVSI